MNALLSYLAAQARERPADTLRFVVGEAWRRSRARFHPPLDLGIPDLRIGDLRERLALFVPGPSAHLQPPRPGTPWVAETTSRAQRISAGEHEIFGEPYPLGPRFDWHRDPKSGHRWPLEPAGRLRVLDAPPGSDVKRPWELARFHHGLALCAAAAIHPPGAEFAGHFMASVRDWISANPWPLGIHWAMPMEVAIRAINWIAGTALLAAAGPLDVAFSQELLTSLYLHARHLWASREWNPVARANHYLACVVGLLWLGTLFEETAEGRQWSAFARRELLAEMDNQVGADGVAREGSSGYHAFVAELFLTGGLLIARHAADGAGEKLDLLGAMDRTCGKPFTERLGRMFSFLAALCAGRDHPPVWGDADDGRVLPFSGAGVPPVAALAALGRDLFGLPSVPGTASCAAETIWRVGRIPQVRSTSPVAACLRPEAFADSGFYFFTSPRMRGSIRCGPLGVHGWANHAHNDQLSFEFALDGRPVLVDPGLPCYADDPAARNLFRSTRYHNTVVVAGAEQNRFWPQLLFRIVDDTRSRTLRWQSNDQGTAFAGVHHGYLRLPEKAVVRRELLMESNDTLTLRDTIELSRPATVTWYFHCAPDIVPRPLPETPAAHGEQAHGNRLHSRWQLGPVQVAVWVASAVKEIVARAEMGWVAPRFGQRAAASILQFQALLAGKSGAVFVFAPEASSA